MFHRWSYAARIVFCAIFSAACFLALVLYTIEMILDGDDVIPLLFYLVFYLLFLIAGIESYVNLRIERHEHEHKPKYTMWPGGVK